MVLFQYKEYFCSGFTIYFSMAYFSCLIHCYVFLIHLWFIEVEFCLNCFFLFFLVKKSIASYVVVFLIHSTSFKKNCLTFEDNVFLIHLWSIEVEFCLNCFFLFCLALFGQKKYCFLCLFFLIHSTSLKKIVLLLKIMCFSYICDLLRLNVASTVSFYSVWPFLVKKKYCFFYVFFLKIHSTSFKKKCLTFEDNK